MEGGGADLNQVLKISYNLKKKIILKRARGAGSMSRGGFEPSIEDIVHRGGGGGGGGGGVGGWHGGFFADLNQEWKILLN